MKTLAILALIVFASARPAGADATLRWSGCSFPALLDVEPYAAGPHVLTVTVDGGLGEYNAWSGFETTILVIDRCSHDGQFVPQAWRFDAGGWNDSGISWNATHAMNPREAYNAIASAMNVRVSRHISS